VAALGLAGATACGDGGTGPRPRDDITGRYEFVEVRGPKGADSVAPFLIDERIVGTVTVRAEYLDGYVTLSDDSTYAAASRIQVTRDGRPDPIQEGPPRTGTYSVTSTTVVFVADDDPATDRDDDVDDRRSIAARSGDRLTFTDRDDVVGELTIILERRELGR